MVFENLIRLVNRNNLGFAVIEDEIEVKFIPDKNFNLRLIEEIHSAPIVAFANQIYIFNEQIWQTDDTGLSVFYQEVCDLCDVKFSLYGLDTFRHMIASHFPFNPMDFNCCKSHIPFQNGEYNITTKQLEAFNRKHYFTYQLKYDYRPTFECPTFQRYLSQVLPDQTLRDKLCIFAAYSLTNRIDLTKALIIYGPGGNGKSKFMEIMIKILDSLCCQVPLQTMGDRFNRMMFYNKLANIYDDLSADDLQSDSFFKILTGSSYIEAELKGINERVKYHNTCKCIFSCNQLPSPRFDVSDAFYQRWLIIPFLTPIRGTAADDPFIGEKLETEMQGIIGYLLTFLSRIEELRPAPIDQVKHEWMQYSNSALAYLETVQRDPELYVKCSTLYEAYLRFCGEKKLLAVTNKKFGMMCQQQGISMTRRVLANEVGQQYVYLGVYI